MNQPREMNLRFRCPPELEGVLPQPIPAVLGLPDWFKSMPSQAFNPSMGTADHTVKKCPPFIDAMTYGFLFRWPLISWCATASSRGIPKCRRALSANTPIRPSIFMIPARFLERHSATRTGSSSSSTIFGPSRRRKDIPLLFTHPLNRTDLPFTTLTGLVDCDSFSAAFVNFPARWHDMNFNGVLPKGTPVAQCLPVKREAWSGSCEKLSVADIARRLATRSAIKTETDVYRHQFRAPKR